MKQEEQVRDYFTRDAERFDTIYEEGQQQNLVQRLIDAMFRRRNLRRRVELAVGALVGAQHVLDVGCGSGRAAAALVHVGVERVTGIDLSDEMVRLAKELAVKSGVAERCTFICVPAEEFEAEEPFDGSLALGVMDYLDDPGAMLARMKGFTRGRVVVSFPRRGMLFNPARRLWLMTKHCPVYFYSRRRIEDLYRGAGLKLVDLLPFGTYPTTGSYVAVGETPDGA
jgi:2-polyprenyl-3-methyl-5-hydroxy-6-metoxy-1,4-benzoquinol methylase